MHLLSKVFDFLPCCQKSGKFVSIPYSMGLYQRVKLRVARCLHYLLRTTSMFTGSSPEDVEILLEGCERKHRRGS